MWALTPAERLAVEAFTTAVRGRLGRDLLELRLFGSRARGEGTEESDLDVAVIVTATALERKREIQDLAFDIGLEHSVLLAPLVLSDEQLAVLRARELRLAADLEREGIPL